MWRDPPPDLQLAADAVHIWRVELNRPTANVQELRQFLIADEIERAGRFYFEKDRLHWTVARAALRVILGRYLQCDPLELRFAANEYGKPAIVVPLKGARLHFNLSHSGDLALYACAWEKEVGVDVEYMKSGVNYNELATHFFSAHECASLGALSPDRQEEAFFLCWSRKEAYIKARGKGLSLPLDQFDVSLVPGEPACLLGSREDPLAAERWFLHALWPGERYAGALVTEGSAWQLAYWRW